MKIKTVPKPKASKVVKKKGKHPGSLEKLIDFLIFLRDNYLEEVARENIKNVQAMDIPLMRLFRHIPEKQLLEQSMKSMRDNIDNLKDGSYVAKQKANLKLWEEDKLPGIKKDDITPTDLVMVYALQKKAYFKFLPLYTENAQLALEIMEAVEELNLHSQNEAFNLLFRLTKESEANLKKTNELLLVSEERMRQLTQNVKDYAIYMLDTTGHVVTWGKGAEKIKGYRTEEIIGKHFNIFYTKEEQEKNIPANNLELALEHGRYEKEGWRVRKDRSLFWADAIYTPVYGDDARLKGFAVVSRDLTEKKKAEEELKNSNNFLNSVLENMPNMVFVKEARALRFVRFNKAGEKLLGFSRNELLGKNDYDLFPREQADSFTKKDKEVLKDNEVLDIPEEEIDTKDGKRWLHTRKISIKNSEGKPLYLLGVSEDITEKRESEAKIRNLNAELSQNVRQLETVNKELDSFSYSVSHDLRAPLRAIHGYAKILLEDYKEKLDDEGKDMMSAVMNNAIKMGQLIDDLLAFSRMGKRDLTIMPVDMTLLATSALATIKSAYAFPLKANISIMPLLPCSADPNLMELVLANLLSNAIKYSSKTARPSIELNSYHQNGENIYYVKDNGVGFDMQYSNKLFGVFQRLHSTQEFEGTGVGLALVKRIVTRHGGRVWAESEPNKGATFYIALQKSN